MSRTFARAIGVAALSLTVGTACASTKTVEEERAVAKDVERQIRRDLDVLHDRVVDNYIDDIGERIVLAAGPQAFDFSFTVHESDDVNAAAYAGGTIFVTTELILTARNVSELAGVMAHEVGHVSRRHVADNLARAQNAGLVRTAATIAGGILTGTNVGAWAASQLSGAALLGYVNSFSREAESEADAFAVGVLPAAGYDPVGLVTLFETLGNTSGITQTTWRSSHPAPTERAQTAAGLIEAREIPDGLQKTDNGKLEIIQHRIRLLTGKLDKDS